MLYFSVHIIRKKTRCCKKYDAVIRFNFCIRCNYSAVLHELIKQDFLVKIGLVMSYTAADMRLSFFFTNQFLARF